MQLVHTAFVLQKTPDIISCERNHKHSFNGTCNDSISEQAQVRHVGAVEERNWIKCGVWAIANGKNWQMRNSEHWSNLKH